MRFRAVVPAALLVLLAPVILQAGVTVVRPGAGTPLQDAIDAAVPGDTLLLAPEDGFDFATFSEAIVIDKSLTIRGVAPKDGNIIIDAGCAAPIAIDVAADNVRLEGLVVQRSTGTDINVVGHDRVRMKSVTTMGPGFFGACPGTEIGINVENSSRVKIRKSIASGAEAINAPVGYGTAAIRIANILSGQSVKLAKVTAFGSTIGLLLENVAGPVKVAGSGLNRNVQGVSLVGVAAARLVRNRAFNSEAIGFGLDASSSGNRLVGNEISGSGTLDVLDDGSANCWRHNKFVTGSVGCGP